MSLSYNDSLCVAVKQRWFCADVLPIHSQPEQCDLPSALIKLQSRRSVLCLALSAALPHNLRAPLGVFRALLM